MQGMIPQTLDAKGRFVIPVVFRDELASLAAGKPMTLTYNPYKKGLTLFVYDDWKPIFDKLVKIDDFDIGLSPLKDAMLSGAQTIGPEELGERILISAGLRKMAALDKEIIVGSSGRMLNIWHEENWMQRVQAASGDSITQNSNFLVGLTSSERASS